MFAVPVWRVRAAVYGGLAMQIAGKVALVTGGWPGPARASRSASKPKARAWSSPTSRPAVDVTDDAQLKAAIDEARPDILVNNAGGGGHIPPFFPDGDWSAKLDLNLESADARHAVHGARAWS